MQKRIAETRRSRKEMKQYVAAKVAAALRSSRPAAPTGGGPGLAAAELMADNSGQFVLTFLGKWAWLFGKDVRH